MDKKTQIQRAQHFRALHDRSRVLLLPNAWDAGSAQVFASLGFDAIATTSGGLAWSLGYADGEQAPLDEVIAAIRRIVRVTPFPVSVDFEGGYGDSPEAVTVNVRRVIDAGIAGINLEDGIRHETLRDIGDGAQRIAAARKAANDAGVPIVINARINTWMVGGEASDAERIEDTLRRAHAYLEAGADCIYPIALGKPEVIAQLCAAIKAPVNIGASANSPNLAELGRFGVARVSTATRLATVAYSAAYEVAKKLKSTGQFDGLDAALDYETIQRLFANPETR